MTILVTGAAGFVGGALVRCLSEEDQVVALFRGPGGMVADARRGVQWIQQDLAERLRDDLPTEVDAVVHLAQSSRYRDFPGGAVDMVEVNIAGTVRLLEYARRSGARSFVMCSTGAVYSPGPTPVTENSRLAPSNFYSASKLVAEQLAEHFRDELAVAILRPFFIYGPGQQGDRFMPGLLGRIREGEPVQLAGKDGIRLNPIFVDDAVEVLRRAVANELSTTLNVAGPDVASIRTLAGMLGETIDRSPTFVHVEPAPDLIADIRQLRAALGETSPVGLAEGLRRTARADTG